MRAYKYGLCEISDTIAQVHWQHIRLKRRVLFRKRIKYVPGPPSTALQILGKLKIFLEKNHEKITGKFEKMGKIVYNILIENEKSK